MTRWLTAFSCAIFFWAFWDASSVGIYAGTVETGSEPECRYITSRGSFQEPKSAVAARSNSAKWCPSTYARQADKPAGNKVAAF
ncbi:MAG: hypothetical protein AB7H77_08545 [Bdellovibrionales bacterium]